MAYNPLLASEIYFHDLKHNVWIPAFNTDPEIFRLSASFAEAENYRGWQAVLTRQADFNAHSKRKQRLQFVRETIKKAVNEKKAIPGKSNFSKAGIRENRAQEKANERSPGLNGSLPSASAMQGQNDMTEATSSESVKVKQPNKFEQLWSKVNAISKN